MKSPIKFMLKCQSVVLVIMTIAGISIGYVAAYSTALGAFIYIASNAYFSLYAFRFQGSHLGPWIARSFSWGESGKLALAAVGFALVFRFVRPLNAPLLFVGFCSMIILQWFVARKIAEAFAEQNEQQVASNELEKAKKAD